MIPARVGRPPGSSVDPQARRAALLDAAERVIRHRGATATMDELAAEAGLTKPILYASFGDKAGLADALAERFAHELVQRLAVAVTAATPRELVRRAVDGFIGWVEEDPNVYEFVVRESVNVARGREGTLARLRIFEVPGRAISMVLGHLLAEAGGDPARAEPLAFAVMGMALTVGEWWLDRRSLPRAAVVDLMADLVWAGFQGQGLAGPAD